MTFLFCLSFTIQAQHPLFPSQHLLFFRYNNPSSTNQSMMQSKKNIFQTPLPPISSGSIKELPFFCAMECKVRKHTNIWIKLRAGDDASYMKMIKEGKQ